MPETITVKTERIGSALAGQLWLIGWLFTIGFLKLSLVKGFFALIVWPFYLGRFFHQV
jgi:hypothetical protein